MGPEPLRTAISSCNLWSSYSCRQLLLWPPPLTKTRTVSSIFVKKSRKFQPKTGKDGSIQLRIGFVGPQPQAQSLQPPQRRLPQLPVLSLQPPQRKLPPVPSLQPPQRRLPQPLVPSLQRPQRRLPQPLVPSLQPPQRRLPQPPFLQPPLCLRTREPGSSLDRSHQGL